MNPKQDEWLAMEHLADLRREAAGRHIVAMAQSPTQDRPGRRSSLKMGQALLRNAIRGAFRAVHLISPRGRAIS